MLMLHSFRVGTQIMLQPSALGSGVVAKVCGSMCSSGSRGVQSVAHQVGPSIGQVLCVQVMHVGPYSAEAPTIQALHAFAADQGLELRVRHHETYLGDPRRSAPEKLMTIIRQPMMKAR